MADLPDSSPTPRGRPRVDVPRSPFERVLTVLAAAILIASFSVVGWYWPRLPASVPVHFNAAGQIDGYGSKLSLLAFPAIFTVMFVVLSALERVPWIYNYPWRITPENAARQYRPRAHAHRHTQAHAGAGVPRGRDGRRERRPARPGRRCRPLSGAARGVRRRWSSPTSSPRTARASDSTMPEIGETPTSADVRIAAGLYYLSGLRRWM